MELCHNKRRLIRGEKSEGLFQTAYIKRLLLPLSPSVLPVLWVCLESAGNGTNKAPCRSLVTLCLPHCRCSCAVSTQCKYCTPVTWNFELLSRTFSDMPKDRRTAVCLRDKHGSNTEFTQQIVPDQIIQVIKKVVRLWACWYQKYGSCVEVLM